ncbi:MAG: hypothetical protein LBE84_02615, partial [Planctomycetota bacterium]|nr:hypothetical protein [Planctomycetota bacterium]
MQTPPPVPDRRPPPVPAAKRGKLPAQNPAQALPDEKRALRFQAFPVMLNDLAGSGPPPDDKTNLSRWRRYEKRWIVFPEGNWRNGGKAIPECAFPEPGARTALFEETAMDAEKNEDQARQSGDGAIPEL